MRHLPILHLALRHAYHADGRCVDFRVQPADMTARMLAAHRCVLRPQADGAGISIAVDDESKAFVPLPPDALLVFHLRLVNPDFVLFTDLREHRRQPAPLYTAAGLPAGSGGDLTLTSRRQWGTETVFVSRPAVAERFALGGRPRAGVQPQEFEMTDAHPGVAILEYDEEASVLVVDTRSAPRGVPLHIRYPVRPRLPAGVFAAVEIPTGPGGPPTGDPVEFRITFRPEQKRWSYYCVTDLTAAVDTFEIVDLRPPESGEPLMFSAENRRDLEQEPDPSDPVAALLAKQYTTLRRIRFISDRPIPCRSVVSRHLELRLDGQRLSGPLPNPPLANFSNLDLLGPHGAEREASQFCIVKHLTRSLSNMGG